MNNNVTEIAINCPNCNRTIMYVLSTWHKAGKSPNQLSRTMKNCCQVCQKLETITNTSTKGET